MEEFELMSNGNLKFLGIPLGSDFLMACKRLSSLGISLKTENGFNIKQGNDNRVRFVSSFSFAKSCLTEIWTENSGNRINTIIIHGDENKGIRKSVVIPKFKQFAEVNKLKIDERENDNGQTLYSIRNNLVEMELQTPKSSNGIVCIWVNFINNLHCWSVDKYVYNDKFVNELYMNYLKELSEGPRKKLKLNVVKAPDLTLIIKIIGLICIIVLSFIIANSYRYETFKDKNRYMRYDKWTETYEKYDIPSGEWRRNF